MKKMFLSVMCAAVCAAFAYAGETADGKETVDVEWYRKAAERGQAEAQLFLGICCKYGIGMEKAPAEAVKW